MKLIRTSNQTFGPFQTVTVGDDRLIADDVHLCFTVIGNEYSIEDVTEYSFPEAKVVPDSVTMRQARLALLSEGLLNTVNQTVASIPGPQGDAARIEWEFSSEVFRNRALVQSIGLLLGLDKDHLDNLFIKAAKL